MPRSAALPLRIDHRGWLGRPDQDSYRLACIGIGYTLCTARRNALAMTRPDLIERLAFRADISRRGDDAVVRTMFEAMSEAFARGDHIAMRDFGVFSIRQRQARSGRNPQTGEAVPVAAKKALPFKVGRQQVQLVNDDPKALAAFREQQHEQRRSRDRQRRQLNLF